MLLLAAMLLSACDSQPDPSTIQSENPVPVSFVTLQSEPVTLSRELPGRTRAFLTAEIRPQVTGIVRERLFVEGSQVEVGAPLYQLDDATYRAAYKVAEANVARADAALEVSQLNVQRAEKLRGSNAISDQDYQNLIAVKLQAAADLEMARAQLQSARVRLDYARIKSPIAGRVGKSTVTQGALVTADQSMLLTTVHQLDPIYVDVTQSASELLVLRRAIAKGVFRRADDIPVRIVLDDGSTLAEEGTLTFSDAAVDPTTGSVAMRVVVPNPDLVLLPGMYVRAVISSAIIHDGLLVPQRGITRSPDGQAIAMVVADDNTVEQHTVTVGNTIGDQWLVEDGLSAGDRVIVEGLQKIKPGAVVIPSPFAAYPP
jgi:membrane fusion protein (multidrug efflux system)